ncbi:MAG: 50S ribosomal protein L16 [Patescibacteria group bacterium]|nr:50S ribosomal protein L16 [Patescibacteria group bacterium]
MLQPKKTKYKNRFRGRMKGMSVSGSRVCFGDFGLKSLTRSIVSASQIEAARKAISNHTKRKAKIWIRIFPDKPITKKAPGAPMGAGKGDIDHWGAVVKPGRIIFEIGGVPFDIAEGALIKAGHKLSVRTKLVKREGE